MQGQYKSSFKRELIKISSSNQKENVRQTNVTVIYTL